MLIHFSIVLTTKKIKKVTYKKYVTAGKKQTKISARIVRSPYRFKKNKEDYFGIGDFTQCQEDFFSHGWFEYHEKKHVFISHMKNLKPFILSYLGSITGYARNVS